MAYEDLLKLLGGQKQPEENMSEQIASSGFPAQVPAIQEAKTDAELANVNQEAKSPYQMTKPELVEKKVGQEINRTPAGQLAKEVQAKPVDPYQELLAKRDKMYEEKDAEIKAAKEKDSRNAMLANVAKALGSLGAADIQRTAGVKAGLESFQPVQGPDTASEIATDRERILAKLKGDLEILQAGKKAQPSELDQAKLDVEKKKLELQEKKLDQEGKKAAPLTFEEKEQIKSKYRVQEEDVKQQNKIRKDNLKTRAAAEKSMSDVDEQIEKVRRAKKLLQKTVKEGGVADTGPIDQYITGLGSEGQQLRQAFNDLSLAKMSKLFQGMSKAVDSDAERKMFEQSQASLGNYPSVNMQILNDMEKSLNSLKGKNQKLYNRYDKKGQEVVSEKVDVILPDGRRGKIDADKVDAFQAKYPDAQILN